MSHSRVNAAPSSPDVVGHLEPGLLAHGLHLADQLAHVPFLQQLRGDVGVQHHADSGVGLAHEALLANGLYQQVFFGQLDIYALQFERVWRLALYRCHDGRAVGGLEMRLYPGQKLAVARPQRL